MGFNTFYCKTFEETSHGFVLKDTFELGVNDWLPRGEVTIPHVEVWRCF